MTQTDTPELGTVAKAREAITLLTQPLAALAALGDALDRVASIEALTVQVEARLRSYQEREAAILANLNLQAVIETNAEVKKMRAEAKAEAERIIEEAKAEQHKMIKATREVATNIKMVAMQDVDDMQKNMESARKALAAVGRQ
jgi:cell division septum initiation protein DivIVA